MPPQKIHGNKGEYTKEEGMQLPMVAIQTAKCKSLLKIATFSISAWAGEDWTFVALWFCVVVKSSGVLGECYLAYLSICRCLELVWARVKSKAGILFIVTIYTLPSLLVACPLL